jgi:hypothetical protein
MDWKTSYATPHVARGIAFGRIVDVPNNDDVAEHLTIRR